MFRTFSRKFLPNPLDQMLKKTAKREGKRILLGWNRGLGDIALGLYAIINRIRKYIPDAKITFVTRPDLKEGFSLLDGIEVIIDSSWSRGAECSIHPDLKKKYDLVIEKPSPTDWVTWQRGNLVPKLNWDVRYETLYESFDLNDRYIGVQVIAETPYGYWRNWPLRYWKELFDTLEKMGEKVLLFGYGSEPKFTNGNLVDLRGKTNLFELLSIVKNRVHSLILPDSGISSMVYYLDASFPIKQITFWADPNHGILKQNVSSPNPQLIHKPLIGENRDLSTVHPSQVIEHLFPVEKTGAIILAGGLGSRLGFEGPKGMFKVAGKTLFEWKMEKIPTNVPVAIMTSPLNHEKTVKYFEENHYFGRNVHFFSQEMQRYMDEDKRPVYEKAPNGNGSVFFSFVKSGLHRIFGQMGIEKIVVSNIENPLSHPLDPILVHLLKDNDAVIQCIEKEEVDHPMGMIEEEAGYVKVVEYTDLDPEKNYHLAYSGQMAFSLPFFVSMAGQDLPLHWNQKKVGNRWLYKGEKYIFDVLKYTRAVKVFCSKKSSCYAPVKSKESVEKIEKVLR